MRRLAALLVGLWLAGPVAAAELVRSLGPAAAPRHVVLRSTTNFAVLGPVIEAFLATRPDLRLTYEQWGSNDLYALARAECRAARPEADLLISSAVHHMVGLVNEGCAASHVSAATRALPPALIWRDQLWGVTREPAVMVYNRARLAPAEVPRSRFDLLDLLRPRGSRYEGRVATYDIEDSGLGFLLAFADSLEASTFGGLMEAFGRSGAVATCCSAEIIDKVIAGEFLVAYNVLGSYALLRAAAEPALGVIAPEDYTLTLARAAMIPQGAAGHAGAADLVDFLLSPEGRQRLEAQRLIVRLEAEDGALLELPGQVEALERPIGMGPPLLVALDAHKRQLFTERWRDAFPQRPAPHPSGSK
ncbi:ABC transporter substrate-binding protein [Roseivivax sp. CAU 1761]